jgi:hypothetical protein
MNKPQAYVYDYEFLSNIATVIFRNIKTNEAFSFVVHESRDDRLALYEFLETNVANLDYHIGYNNLFFDGQMSNFILHNKQMLNDCSADFAARQMYLFSQHIINEEKPVYHVNYLIRQLDVFKLMGYDTKFVSLKTLQGNMRWAHMQDMPIPFDKDVDSSQITDILAYNDNDVLSTKSFFESITSEIELRKIISKIYGFNALNMTSTKIGETIFVSAICKAKGIASKDIKKLVNHNQKIEICDIIFPHVKVRNPAFAALRTYLETQSVVELKGFFTEIPIGIHEKKLLPFVNKNKDYFSKKKNELEKLNVVAYNNTFVIGSGGLHSVNNNKTIFKSKKGRLLVDIDFSSYYPNQCIANDLYPAHLGKAFVEVYADMYAQRLHYKKIAKKDKSNIEANVIQLALKLALNSVEQ